MTARERVAVLRIRVRATAARCVAACLRYEAAGRNLDVGEEEEERERTWRENERAENAVDRAGKAHRLALAALARETAKARKRGAK